MSAAEQLAQGWRVHQARNYAAAEAAYQGVLAADPYNADAWCYLGILRHDQRRYEDAQAAYRRAIALRPDFAVAYNNLGNTLATLERREEAIGCFERAAALRPNYANAFKNKGSSLTWLGRLDEAVACYQKALSLAPQDPQTHRDLGVVYLLQGRFREGWAEYEYRWRMPQSPLPPLRQPRWDGASLDGKTIFLLAEQGMGDMVHFIRYAARLKELYRCRVAASCHPPLLPLLMSVSGPDGLIPMGGEPVQYDVFAPLLSVPGILGDTIETFPATIPYLKADEQRVAFWKEELDCYEGLRVGIAWQGSRDYEADHMRSAPLAAMLPLARVPGVTLFSLQKGYGEEQLAPLADRLPVVPLGPRLDTSGPAFLDTAAALMALDLVITVDTSLGHIGGALGVPTWLALAHVPDWRWGMTGESTVWYPTLRLFRQSRRGDWATVFEPMAEALAHLAQRRTASRKSLQARPDQSMQEESPTDLRKGTSEGVVKEGEEREGGPGDPSCVRGGGVLVSVPISSGELLDKITILEIKAERIADEAKRANVGLELEALNRVRRERLPEGAELTELIAQLKAVNEQLWDIEDAIRDCERRRDFGPAFIELARSVYRSNDRRAALKRQINDLLGSPLVEEKSYAEY